MSNSPSKLQATSPATARNGRLATAASASNRAVRAITSRLRLSAQPTAPLTLAPPGGVSRSTKSVACSSAMMPNETAANAKRTASPYGVPKKKRMSASASVPLPAAHRQTWSNPAARGVRSRNATALNSRSVRNSCRHRSRMTSSTARIAGKNCTRYSRRIGDESCCTAESAGPVRPRKGRCLRRQPRPPRSQA